MLLLPEWPFLIRGRGVFLAGCLTSQQHASVAQGRICSDNFTDQTFYLTQSQNTDTDPTSPSTDPITPGAWQGSHWSANFLSHWYDSTPEKSWRKRDSNPGSSALKAALTTRPMRRFGEGVAWALVYGRKATPTCTWISSTLVVSLLLFSILCKMWFLSLDLPMCMAGMRKLGWKVCKKCPLLLLPCKMDNWLASWLNKCN